MIGGPCRRCGVEHDCHTPVFEIGVQVRITSNDPRFGRPDLMGVEGVTYSNTRYGGPWSIRVQFKPGTIDLNYPNNPQRENFSPCELEVVEEHAST